MWDRRRVKNAKSYPEFRCCMGMWESGGHQQQEHNWRVRKISEGDGKLAEAMVLEP